MSISKESILKKFELFNGATGGIDSWLSEKTRPEIFVRLGNIDVEPLSMAQLNQLLLLSHEAGVSRGFFEYYWLSTPNHPYDVTKLDKYEIEWLKGTNIKSLDHLRWGLYRLYVDALLYFGNIRSAYRYLRSKSKKELEAFFESRMYQSENMKERGPAIPLNKISKDDRYLISEMACKSYDAPKDKPSELRKVLTESWQEHHKKGGETTKIRQLLLGDYVKTNYSAIQGQLQFSADDIMEDNVSSLEEIETKYDRIEKMFIRARDAALQNTDYYLSMVNELDVYVATSMRIRDDFRNMADICDKVFDYDKLKEYYIRYFDPTLSAAEGHEDKGLIECLMVKSAKVLIYAAGSGDSYGKDAEAAMALSLGKPVIFYSTEEKRTKIYRDVHPLSRLIQFDTGVAVGAMVTDEVEVISELLYRIFTNTMEYELVQPKQGYFQLKEKLTQSVVRLQTSDELLRETFWNYYHEKPHASGIRST